MNDGTQQTICKANELSEVEKAEGRMAKRASTMRGVQATGHSRVGTLRASRHASGEREERPRV